MTDSFDCFSVIFGKGEVFVSGKSFPLGQCTTNILNLNGAALTELDRCIGALMPAVQTLFQEKTDSAARSAQELLNAVWDLVFILPLYWELKMDLEISYHLFLLLFPTMRSELKYRMRIWRDTRCFKSF